MVELLLGQAPKFFGFRGGVDPKFMRLREIKTAKAPADKIEMLFEPDGTTPTSAS